MAQDNMIKATLIRPEEIKVGEEFDKHLASAINMRFNACIVMLADWIGIRPEVVIEKTREILDQAEIKQD